jgi:hypothetical protein
VVPPTVTLDSSAVLPEVTPGWVSPRDGERK